jgi:hypothetical protein
MVPMSNTNVAYKLFGSVPSKLSFPDLETLINKVNPENLSSFLAKHGWDTHAYFEAVVTHDAEFLEENFNKYF